MPSLSKKMLLLSGTSLLTVLALMPVEASATCTSPIMGAGDECTIAATGGDIAQPVAIDAALTTSTPVASLWADGVAATSVTVEAGAGIINASGNAIGTINGGMIDTITNQGLIGSNVAGAAVNLQGIGNTTINNGTASDAVIRNTNDEGVAIWVGGAGAPTAGDLTINQGSATSSGRIAAAPGDTAGIFVGNRSGAVTINNVQGSIEGATGLDLTAAGPITIVNGDGTRAGQIISNGSGRAIQIGTNNYDEGMLSRFTITNNVGSEIRAEGAGDTAIRIDSNLSAPSSITNRGLIAAGSGGAAIDLTSNTSAANVSVTNSGTITGAVKLADGDSLTLAGGTVTGDVTTTGSSTVSVTGDSAVTGSVGAPAGNGGATPVTIVFQNDRTLSLADGGLNANVRAATDGQGTLSLSGVTGLYHDLGTAGHGLKVVRITDGVVDLDNDNVYVATTIVEQGATLGMCTTAEDGCSGSTVADPSNTFHGNLLVRGALDLNRADVIALKAGANSARGDFTAEAGSTIRTVIRGDGNTSGAGSTNLSYIKADGTATLESGVTVAPVVNGITISQGARYILIDGTGTASVGDVTATDSAMVRWRILRGDDESLGQDGGDVYLVASRTDLEHLVGGKLKGIANALTNVGNDQAMQSLIEALSRQQTNGDVEEALRQLSPNSSVGAATVQGSGAAASANMNSIGARTNDVRTAQAEGLTGVATGDAPRGLGLWIQGLGFSGSQDRRNGQDGYDATAGGVVVGGDMQVADPLRMGLAFSYAHSNVDATGASSGSGADIDSYQGTLYASYTGSPWYIDGALVYGRHKYDTERAIAFPGFAAVAKGDFSGDQYGAHVAGGYPLAFGNTVVTPNASLAYSLLKQEAYTETGAGGANLAVDSRSDTSVRSGLGVKVAHAFQAEATRIVPEGRVTWFHEYNTEAMDQTARFAAGGSSFTTTGVKPAADSVALGLGLTIVQADHLTFSANYDAELKDKYVGHNGMLQVRLDF